MASVYSQEFNFGAGSLWGTRTDITGTTPRQFGTLQDVQISFSGDIKPLYGQNQYALALARGKTMIEITAKFAQISGGLWNDLYFGSTLATGQNLIIQGEADVAAATFTVAQGSLWLADLGVWYAATGQQLTATLSTTPATVGNYYAAGAGVYHANTTDVGKTLTLDYRYNAVSTGFSTTLTNPLMGFTPVFRCDFEGSFDGREAVFTFLNCVAGKLTLPTKNDDWQINEMTIQASANAANTIGTINFGA